MQPLSFGSITVDDIHHPVQEEMNIKMAVLRLDKIHPEISGNKWFKLKYYLEDAKSGGNDHILSFGGAYSNHIVATAAAGQLLGFKTTGVIRGEEPRQLSHSLLKAKEYGMDLVFTSRDEYSKKKLYGINGKPYLINEGGYGKKGAAGAAEILNYCQKTNYSHICCAVGTSTMMAGLIKASNPGQETIGLSVLKNNLNLQQELVELLTPEEQNKNFRLIHDYHFGGYARHNIELINFMNEFYGLTGIPSDFVYTAKLFYGIVDMVKKNLFPPGSNILLVHSGGLQGNLSLSNGTLIF